MKLKNKKKYYEKLYNDNIYIAYHRFKNDYQNLVTDEMSMIEKRSAFANLFSNKRIQEAIKQSENFAEADKKLSQLCKVVSRNNANSKLYSFGKFVSRGLVVNSLALFLLSCAGLVVSNSITLNRDENALLDSFLKNNISSADYSVALADLKSEAVNQLFASFGACAITVLGIFAFLNVFVYNYQRKENVKAEIIVARNILREPQYCEDIYNENDNGQNTSRRSHLIYYM